MSRNDYSVSRFVTNIAIRNFLELSSSVTMCKGGKKKVGGGGENCVFSLFEFGLVTNIDCLSGLMNKTNNVIHMDCYDRLKLRSKVRHIVGIRKQFSRKNLYILHN